MVWGELVRFASASCLLLAMAAATRSADTPPIRVPDVAPLPLPTPPNPAPPGGALRLTQDVLFVVDSDVEVLVLASPEGLVKVTREESPLRIRGKFIDNPAKTVTRKFSGKAVYTVEGVADGTCEILVIPVGATDGKQVVRRTVLVETGVGPQPPPGPNPPPKPPEPLKSFRVVFIFESGQTLTAAQNSVLYGKTVEDYLNATCTGGKNGWRRRDKDLGGESDPTMASLWAAVKPAVTVVPCVAVERNGKVEIIPLEATPAAMVAKLKTYAGDK